MGSEVNTTFRCFWLGVKEKGWTLGEFSGNKPEMVYTTSIHNCIDQKVVPTSGGSLGNAVLLCGWKKGLCEHWHSPGNFAHLLVVSDNHTHSQKTEEQHKITLTLK